MFPLQSIAKVRQRRIRREGSPTFIYEITSIPAGEFVIIQFDSKDEAQKYLPFTEAKVHNNSGRDLNVYVNQKEDDKRYVASGTIRDINDRFLWSLKVENRDGVNAASEVIIDAKTAALEPKDLVRRLPW